ncbi:MAG: hypothetical protein ACLQU1_10215 [Bryobacteraceae bacterium]
MDATPPRRRLSSTKASSSVVAIFLCPVYVRGEAWGVVMNFPWGALARLGLARAYALEGDTA